MTVKYVTIKSKEIHIHPTKENSSIFALFIIFGENSQNWIKFSQIAFYDFLIYDYTYTSFHLMEYKKYACIGLYFNRSKMYMYMLMCIE